MLILVDANSGVPVYRQLVDQIRFQIASSQLSTGDELPSTRALSLRLGINPMTVSKAYSILEDEGVITRRPGLALIVSALTAKAHNVEKVERLRRALEPAVTAAVQLGITGERAASEFRKLVDDRSKALEKSE